MATGNFGGTAGHIEFDSGDSHLRLMTIPKGCTSVTIANTSTAGFGMMAGTQFLQIWIPGIHRTFDGYSSTDVTGAQWATVFGPRIGIVNTMTFTLRPHGIKEVWARTTASVSAPCTASFGVTEIATTNNYRTPRLYR